VIRELAMQTGRSDEEAQAAYERELLRLESEATVTTYVPVIARRLREGDAVPPPSALSDSFAKVTFRCQSTRNCQAKSALITGKQRRSPWKNEKPSSSITSGCMPAPPRSS
jgi:hypothetical protein